MIRHDWSADTYARYRIKKVLPSCALVVKVLTDTRPSTHSQHKRPGTTMIIGFAPKSFYKRD